MLGKIISPEQSKMKANDFVTRVANKKRRLHSSQQLSWSSRMGWQVVSTTIFEWLLNLQLKMRTNYCVVAADNLLMKDKPNIEAPSVTCFGLVTCRVKGWQLETGCPLSIKSWSESYFIWKAKVKVISCLLVQFGLFENLSGGWHIVWKQLLPDDDIPSGISLLEVFS